MDVQDSDPNSDKMKADLLTKCEQLQRLQELGELFINEHFESLRAEVDYKAESALSQLRLVEDSQVDINSLNAQRAKILYEFELSEKVCLNTIEEEKKKDAESDSNRTHQQLLERIKSDFAETNTEHLAIVSYEKLAKLIEAEIDKRQSKLLLYKSFIFLPAQEELQLGCLVILNYIFLNEFEIKLIRLNQILTKKIPRVSSSASAPHLSSFKHLDSAFEVSSTVLLELVCFLVIQNCFSQYSVHQPSEK